MSDKFDSLEKSLSEMKELLKEVLKTTNYIEEVSNSLEFKVNSLEGLLQNYAQATGEDLKSIKERVKKLEDSRPPSSGSPNGSPNGSTNGKHFLD